MLPVAPVSFTETLPDEDNSFNAAKYLGLTAALVALIALLLFVWNGSVEKGHLDGQVHTESIASR